MREQEWPSPRDVANARFARFLKELAQYEHAEQRREKLDAFLDAYSAWRRTHSASRRADVERLAEELHALDARFVFHVEEVHVA